MIDIDDIDKWNVADIEKVFQVCSSHAEHCDDRSTNLGSLQAFESWDGEASAAAKRSIGKTRVDFDSHGTHVAAIAKAAKTAADEVSTIKSKLTGLRGEASKEGFRIGGDGKVVRIIQGPYTTEQLEKFEAKRQALQLDVNQLLINAQMADADLAAAIKGADGEMSADEVAKQNHDPTYAAVYGLKSLGLPEYPPGSLTDVEARNYYLEAERRLGELNKQLEKAGLPLEERAKIASEIRNEFRQHTRDLMSNRAAAEELTKNEKNRPLEKLIEDKMAKKGLTREQALQDVIDSSSKSRGSVNEGLGVDEKNPKLPDPKEVQARSGVKPPASAVEPGAVAEGAGSKALRIAGKAAIPLAAAYEVYDGYNQVKAGNETVPEAVGKGVGAVGGMVAGAEVGATIGAFGGPIGAGVGGVVGGVVGGIAGSSVGKTIGGWFS
ncbi:phage head morphogenesis protein [Nocardia sp. NPDC052566]|uniref:phage head morphogenesis protein n=1 Tax=Nocardia sp. NPDC052566 TaxID=3364330 RepID=UPI0037CB6879